MLTRLCVESGVDVAVCVVMPSKGFGVGDGRWCVLPHLVPILSGGGVESSHRIVLLPEEQFDCPEKKPIKIIVVQFFSLDILTF